MCYGEGKSFWLHLTFTQGLNHCCLIHPEVYCSCFSPQMTNVTPEYVAEIVEKFELSDENKQRGVMGIEGNFHCLLLRLYFHSSPYSLLSPSLCIRHCPPSVSSIIVLHLLKTEFEILIQFMPLWSLFMSTCRSRIEQIVQIMRHWPDHKMSNNCLQHSQC